MENLTKEQIERINDVFEGITYGEDFGEEFESLEDKREAIEQYYEAAGFDIGTSDEKFWRFLGVN
jgi:hypothetical protein